MSSTTCDFFQCLLCSSFFGNLWKVEKHVKICQQKEKTPENISDGVGTSKNAPPIARRRGMLPIRKTTFVKCFVPIVRNQIDPEFLSKYAGLQSNDDGEQVSSDCSKVVIKHRRELKLLGVSDDVTIEDILKGPEKRSRLGNIQARANIRRAAAILTVPDQDEVESDDDDDEDKDFIESLLHSSDDDEEENSDLSDYEANFCKKGRKRGRPKGSSSKRIRQRKKYAYLGMVWDGKEHPFKCEYCVQSFPKQFMLSYHIVDKHKDVAKLIECPVSICNKTAITFWAMRDHIRLHSLAERKEIFIEEEIDRVQSHQRNSMRDSASKNGSLLGSGNFSCRFCLINCGDSLEKLKKHQHLEHGTEVNLKCPCCEQTFEKSTWNLICHVKTNHPYYIDPFEERHTITKADNEETKFSCEKCDFKCTYKYKLKNHMRVHEKEEEKRYKCPTCHKGFTQKDNLRRHFTLHLENNPFICDFPDCKKKFNSHYNLRRHKLLHSRDYVKPPRVECPICRQSLFRQDKLRQHMREFHKPDEVINGVPVPASKFTHMRRRIRLPPVRFGKHNKCLKYPSSTEIGKSTSTAVVEALHNPKLKIEQEEIHLVDSIVLEENGKAVHVKGERLSPQTVLPEETNEIQQPSSRSDEASKHNDPTQLIMKSYNLTKIIAQDPAYKKLDPNCTGTQNILKRSYNNAGKFFTCQECDAVFLRAWPLQLHLKSVHNKTLLDGSTAVIAQKNDCVTEDETNEGNNNHQKDHVTLMCGTCAYVGKDAKDLEKHMKSSHRSIRLYRCMICGTTYKNEQRLQNHVKEFHSTSHGSHKCKYCQKAFTTKFAARSHEKSSHKDKELHTLKRQSVKSASETFHRDLFSRT